MSECNETLEEVNATEVGGYLHDGMSKGVIWPSISLASWPIRFFQRLGV